jgi:NADH dehydrogenase
MSATATRPAGTQVQSAARRRRVVVVGGGFGGLTVARQLRRADVDVTLVDRTNHHLFQPLLYQVATAALNPADIAQPIRAILRRQPNVEVLLADATAIDPAGQRVLLADGGAVAWDYLVVATGATHSYFGHDEWQAVAPGLKTVEDALEIRKRILLAFEEAERTQDAETQRAWLSFVVVGGGPTGVEMAGAISEIAFHALKRDFRRIDPTQARVLLLEGTPTILSAYPEILRKKAVEQLRKLGVDVQVSARVTAIDGHGVTVEMPTGQKRIAARTVVWGAGVAASPLARSLGVPLDKAGRVLVTPTLNAPGNERIFVIGDLAAVKQKSGQLVPGVAPAAMQEGRYVAQAIVDLVHEKPIFGHPFEYLDKGSLATIGRKKAIADLPGHIRLWGFLAWMAWLFVHILFLIGFRNRVLVLIEWAWAYLTFQRGSRLITGPVAHEGPHTEVSSAPCSIGDTSTISPPQ